MAASAHGSRSRDPHGEGNRNVAACEAALAIAMETTPDAVLQRIVDLAREVVPARYAALGVADEAGRITDFTTSGIAPEEWSRFGPIPEGQCLTRERISERVPLMIRDIAADPRWSESPPNHPPMQTLLGVPILVGDRVLGNLYLTDRLDGEPFDNDDLQALRMLAVHAAAAIDRTQIHRRVEEQRDVLRIILDSLPAGVVIMAAPDARIELINQAFAEMLFEPASPPGRLPVYNRDLRMLNADGTPVPHDQRPAIRALRGEETRNQQYLLENSRGKQVPILAQAVPLTDASGGVERAVLVVQNITQLREAEQLKDDFLSLVSHEFRTPLTTIHGGAHLLMNQGESLDQHTRLELLGDIVDESERLDRMLANMLILADIMAGRLATRQEPLLVEPLLRKAATEVAARTGKHTFDVDFAPNLPPAEGDPELLVQVLGNLYQNAVKYSPDGGKIHTTATSDGQTVSIALADQGIGMAADEIDRVFERFYRAGLDPSVRGTGLGLYLSRHLVTAMGGEIHASSSGPGEGALFTVTLPAVRDWINVSDEAPAAEIEEG